MNPRLMSQVAHDSEGEGAAGVSLTTHQSGFQREAFGVLDLSWSATTSPKLQ